MKRTILFSIIMLACFTVCGCGEVLVGGGYRGIIEAGMDKYPCWSYQPTSYDPPKRKFDKTVVVLPFQDGRKSEFETHMLLCTVPLLVYCTNTYEPPEVQPNRNFLKNVHDPSSLNASRVMFYPTEDFAKALVAELQAGMAFNEVKFGASAVPADYVISGKILNTALQDTLYSYGVSFFSMFFWAVGLPAGSFSNDLTVEITCTDTKSGEIVYTKVYTAPEYRKIYWMYRQPNGCNYSEMLHAINKLFFEELSGRLEGR